MKTNRDIDKSTYQSGHKHKVSGNALVQMYVTHRLPIKRQPFIWKYLYDIDACSSEKWCIKTNRDIYKSTYQSGHKHKVCNEIRVFHYATSESVPNVQFKCRTWSVTCSKTGEFPLLPTVWQFEGRENSITRADRSTVLRVERRSRQRERSGPRDRADRRILIASKAAFYTHILFVTRF